MIKRQKSIVGPLDWPTTILPCYMWKRKISRFNRCNLRKVIFVLKATRRSVASYNSYTFARIFYASFIRTSGTDPRERIKKMRKNAFNGVYGKIKTKEPYA